MKRAIIAVVAVLAVFLLVRGCGENPERSAKNTVVDFIENIRDGEGKDAVRLLYPPFRDALAQDLKMPIQFTEMKPSEVLSCVFSSMGENIKKVKVLNTSKIDDKHVEVTLKVIDKEGVDKIFTFIVIKDEKSWKIASISGVK